MTSPSATTATSTEADDLPFSSRTRTRIGLAAFAFLAYVPVLLTDTGKIVSDSKSYLYLDPSRFLANVSSIWNSQIAMGTVDHQVLGYLFPLGPIYWVLEELLNVPPWVAERLWLGTLIFTAGLGMRYLLRTLDVRGAGVRRGNARVHVHAVRAPVRDAAECLAHAVGRARLADRVHGARLATRRLEVPRAVRRDRAAGRFRQRGVARVRPASRPRCGSCTRCSSCAKPTGDARGQSCGALVCSRSAHRCGGSPA